MGRELPARRPAGQQHVVMDGASDFLVSLFGERGGHARTSVGVADLPFNIAVEVEMVVEADGLPAQPGSARRQRR